jgi:hypothetical protein
MFGRLFGLIKYVIIAAFAIILASKLLDSVVAIAVLTQHGDLFSFILVLGITTVLLRIASKNRNQEVSSLLIQAAAGCSAIFFGFVVGTTCILMFQHSNDMLAITLGSIAVTGFYCKIVYDPPDLIGMICLMVAATKASMNSVSIEARGVGSVWGAINENLRVLLLSEASIPSMCDILKERPSLPVSVTHLKGFDYLTIPNDSIWQKRIDDLLSKSHINTRRLPPLMV